MVSPAAKLVSPDVGTLSVTPKARLVNRFRPSLSATPTPIPPPEQVLLDNSDVEGNHQKSDSDDNEEWPMEDDWGDEAMLEWQAGPGSEASELEDDVSSVAPEDAGLAPSEEDEDWGRDAYLAWEADDNAGDVVSDQDDEDEPVEAVEETEAELLARGMPEYREWTVKRLQALCEGYGYRTINKHDALVDLAVQCWKAINPRPAPTPRLTFRSSTVSSASTRSNSVSSADIPLSTVKATTRNKSAAKVKDKGKGKAKATTTTITMPASQSDVPEDLSCRFFRMIKDDQALWLRILRYEPIAFDELVSKAIAAGIDDKGWKPKLKRFLDLQAVTYFTEDPTGTRRRH